MPEFLLAVRRGVNVVTVCVLALVVSTPAARGADVAEAVALYKSGRYDQCAELAGQAIENRAYSETWRLLKIRAALATGQHEEALSSLEEALKSYPTSVRLRWLGSRVCRHNGQAERAAEMLGEIDDLVARSSWRYRDAASRVTLGRFYLQRGMDPKQVLEATFKQAKKQDPNYVDAYLASGQLALDKHDYQLAAEDLQRASKLDGTDPEILLGLARAFSPSDSERAQAYLSQALQRNPHHVDSLLFLIDAHIDAERYAEADELLLQIFLVNPLDPRAWAYRTVLAHLRNHKTNEELCRGFALGWWGRNPEVDFSIGKKISQKYRFSEGAAYQQRSLELDATYLPAKMQLSQDLLRLGEDQEGWRLAEEVYQQDGYNIAAHNLVTLEENLSGFRLLEADGLLVRMDAHEADIYGQRVLQLLERARSELCAKYAVELEGTIKIEIFPRQEDFAIRTFGMPGGDGFLGVCFGRVITANSPASRGENPANWQAILWHEFCHVVTLHKTKNKMPRWLSEGISVYEEKQADARWGQSLTPLYRKMILEGGLTPVSQLSGAFLNPPTPVHLEFAYFESALVVEYLIQRYGLDVLQRILVDLGVGMPINESLARYTGSLSAFNQEFAAHAEDLANDLAPDVDWEEPPLEPLAPSEAWAAWVAANPQNFEGLQRYALRLLAERKWEAATQPLEELRDLYPEYTGTDNAYVLLATVHRALKQAEAERDILNEWALRSGDAVAAYLRLMQLHADEEDWDGVIQNAERMMAVNPLLPSPHRFLAAAAEQTGGDQQAISALQALLRMAPLDVADVQHRLARLLLKDGDATGARRHVLLALEEAPRFRDAHRTLLEVVRRLKSDQRPQEPEPTEEKEP